MGGDWLRIDVFRCRCPQCRTTTTLLPDCLLPYRQHSLTAIAAGIEAYLTTPRSYRLVAAATPLPVGESISTFGSHPAAPVPAASTLARWVHSFADTALAWWPILLSALQQRTVTAVRPPAEPDGLAAKTSTPERRASLTSAWGVLWLLGQLLRLLDQTSSRWPQALLWADRHFTSITPAGSPVAFPCRPDPHMLETGCDTQLATAAKGASAVGSQQGGSHHDPRTCTR